MTALAIQLTEVDTHETVSVTAIDANAVCHRCPKEKGPINMGGECHACILEMFERGRDVFKRIARRWFIIDKRDGGIVQSFDSIDEILIDTEIAKDYNNYWVVSPNGNKFSIPTAARL
jgi:hypothetical protein